MKPVFTSPAGVNSAANSSRIQHATSVLVEIFMAVSYFFSVAVWQRRGIRWPSSPREAVKSKISAAIFGASSHWVNWIVNCGAATTSVEVITYLQGSG